MNDSLLEPAERVRVNLRTAIAAVDLQVSELSAQALGGTYATTADTLASSWQKLVPLIAPEPEPERRACPHCQRRIMRAATRCMYCLEKSSPPQV
ncbi:MAG TPA: hypothetical protein VK745_14690 [Polyangiaceae bacterium]|jgi:hypothetical protein|nr:hypothetical protein [Polyangiaceae bacterium]